MDKSVIPAAPAVLNPAARKLWEVYSAELESRGMLEMADLPALSRLCMLESEADALAQEIVKHGATYEDDDKTTRRSPAVMALVNISGVVDSLKRSLSIGAYYREKKEYSGSGKKPEEKKVSRIMQIRKAK